MGASKGTRPDYIGRIFVIVTVVFAIAAIFLQGVRCGVYLVTQELRQQKEES